MRTEQVRFAAGTTGTTLSDTITGREFVVYEIGAEGGQRMLIRLNSANASTYFNVYEPGRGPGDEALAVSEQTGPMVPDLNVFDGQRRSWAPIPSRSTSTATRRARDSIQLQPRHLDHRRDLRVPLQGDFADGLQGRPDLWEVRPSDPDGQPQCA